MSSISSTIPGSGNGTTKYGTSPSARAGKGKGGENLLHLDSDVDIEILVRALNDHLTLPLYTQQNSVRTKNKNRETKSDDEDVVEPRTGRVSLPDSLLMAGTPHSAKVEVGGVKAGRMFS